MIVLDTHAWVWWVSTPEQLSTAARRTIDEHRSDREIFISSISCWEVALLAEKGRLELTIDAADWIRKSEALPFLTFVPVDNLIAVRSTRLPDFPHSDPADRIIVATALTLGANVVTKDAAIRDYGHIDTVW